MLSGPGAAWTGLPLRAVQRPGPSLYTEKAAAQQHMLAALLGVQYVLICTQHTHTDLNTSPPNIRRCVCTYVCVASGEHCVDRTGWQTMPSFNTHPASSPTDEVLHTLVAHRVQSNGKNIHHGSWILGMLDQY